MKLLFSSVIGALLVTALASPLQKRSIEDDKSIPVYKLMKKIKSHEFYEGLMTTVNAHLEQAELAGALFDAFDDEEVEDNHSADGLQALAKAAKVFLEMLNATVPEGANPTEEQLTEFAKKFSGLLHGTEFKIHSIIPDEPELKKSIVVTSDTVSSLKNLLVNHSIEAVGGNNELLEILKQERPAVYDIIKEIQQRNSKKKELFRDPSLKRFLDVMKYDSATKTEKSMKFMAEYILFDFVREQRSEENAIEAFKNFGILVSTLKDPASYDSFEALYRNLKRSEYWESIALLIKNTAKCYAQSLPADKKEKLVEILQEQLKKLKPVFADGQNASDSELSISTDFKNWHNYDGHSLAHSLADAGILDDAPVSDTVKKCLYSDEDKAIYKEIIASGSPIVTDEKLEEIKIRSEIAYSVVALLNQQTKRMHRREGLSEPAMTFVKKLSTVPNSLLSVAPLVAYPGETLEKAKETKLSLVREFNALSAAVKMELVDEFPYHTIAILASLE